MSHARRDAKGVEVVTENEEQRIKDVAGQFCRFQMNNLCVSADLWRLCNSMRRLTLVFSVTNSNEHHHCLRGTHLKTQGVSVICGAT